MSRIDARLSSERKPLSVFFCYAHADAGFRSELEKHLAFLKNSGALKTWHDRMIAPGEEWGRAIDENLKTADIILLLVSTDFANSQYCWDIETRFALERHERGEAQVIPVMIRPVDSGWKETPLGKLKALPEDARPVTAWRSQRVFEKS
jgi:hypothetical protein